MISNKLKELTVGRGHDNQVRITDISISRIHWKFIVINKQIYIEDQASKFGTLIAHNHRSWSRIALSQGCKFDWDGSGFNWWENKPLDLNKCENNTMIQINRTLFIVSVKKPYKIWCKTIKPSNIIKGIPYNYNPDLFGNNFKKLFKHIAKLENRRNTAIDEKDLISSDDLLKK